MALVLACPGARAGSCPPTFVAVTREHPANVLDNAPVLVLESPETVFADVVEVLIDPPATALLTVELANKRMMATMDVLHDEAVEERPFDVAAASPAPSVGDLAPQKMRRRRTNIARPPSPKTHRPPPSGPATCSVRHLTHPGHGSKLYLHTP